MMDVDFLPRHLIIVGGSYIGLEFAQMFRRFGSEVTIIEMGPRLIPREDEDVSAAIKEILEAEGIHIRLNAEMHRAVASAANDVVAATSNATAGAPEVAGSHVLMAVGRRPNTDDLGLENAGVADGCARLHRGGRSAAHQRAWHLGARRLQRQGRIHPHLLQRLRNRRRQSAGQRSPPRQRPHHRLRALHRSAAGPRGHDRDARCANPARALLWPRGP